MGQLMVKKFIEFLKRGELFFTQQVTGSEDAQDLVKEFGAKRKFSDINLEKYVKELKDAGFEIKGFKKMQGQKKSSRNVGAIVYYLKAIPWICQ